MIIIKNKDGATAVEFALILPLLILLLFGIIEFGLVLYNKQIITSACREGVRAGIIARGTRLSNDEIKNEVIKYGKAYLVTFGSDTLDKPNITILPIDTDSSFDPTVNPPVERCTSFGCDLVVDVTYDYEFLFLFNPITFQRFDPIHLQAQTTMRME